MTRPQRREALLDVAAQLINERGITDLSFEAMADAAGVAKTLPYAYFESKDEVLLTLFERVIGGVDDRVKAIVDSGEDLESVIRRSLDVWFEAVRTHGRQLEGLLDGRAVAGLADAVRARDLASHKLWHDVVVEHLGLVDIAAHVLAAMLNESATGIVALWVGRRGRKQDLVDAFVAAALGAAAALAGPPRT
jgi:AcrR family transcriptional regulator